MRKEGETEERRERFEVLDCVGEYPLIFHTRDDAAAYIADEERAVPGGIPYRIRHMIELRPGERIVREEEG